MLKLNGSPDAVTPCGIYVHLPYCRSRCEYCAFVVTTDDSTRNRYLAAVEREAGLLSEEAERAAFDSLYFGGGTPSLVPGPELGRLARAFRSSFRLLPSAEVTLEANPDDVTPERLDEWRAAGVNRLSVGVQSFADQELSAVGRRHDADRAREALELVRRAGFSFSGDLILGLPDQTRESFLASACELAATGAEHVSVYLLETEKSKAIEEDRRRRPERYLSDDAQADLWLELGELLAERSFAHYEISNWALPGRAARHNEKYWRRVPTLGLGISAHELWASRRRANVSSLPVYLDSIEAARRPTALDEIVSPEAEARERLVLGLRLAEGVAAGELEGWIAERGDARLGDDYAGWREQGLLVEEPEGRVRFSERGFLISNEVLCRFV
jgi:oxygen-independent coproporphyrinogen-3 oxidase